MNILGKLKSIVREAERDVSGKKRKKKKSGRASGNSRQRRRQRRENGRFC